MNIYSIYKFQNQLDGMIYIGKTIQDVEKRKYRHLWDVRRGSENFLHRAIRKYGMENFSFDVIYNTFTAEDLNEAERHFIREYDCCVLDGVDKGYNICRGGEGADSELSQKMNRARWGEVPRPKKLPKKKGHAKNYVLETDDGKVYEVNNLSKFCEERGIKPFNLYSLATGKVTRYKEFVRVTRN